MTAARAWLDTERARQKVQVGKKRRRGIAAGFFVGRRVGPFQPCSLFSMHVLLHIVLKRMPACLLCRSGRPLACCF